jgi:hypothetical protein
LEGRYRKLSDKTKSAPKAPQKITAKSTPKPNEISSAAPISKVDDELLKLITESIIDIADEDGWAFLGDLGNLLLKKQPNFDPRNYGFIKLVPLIKSTDKFIVDEKETANKKFKHVYVKIK